MTETTEHVPVGLDPRFVVDLKGRQFPTYPGVLDMATRSGLKALMTEILQYPTQENGGMAVVSATAVFEDGRCFTDIGDASPASVKQLLIPAILRMASTRAKGRVLRDACNVGTALLEELGEEEDAPQHRPQQQQRTANAAGNARYDKNPAASAPTPAPGVDRAVIERKYADWLERAAALGALTAPEADQQEFRTLRMFDPSSGDLPKLAEYGSRLRELVKKLEKRAEQNEAKHAPLPIEERDPFEGEA